MQRLKLMRRVGWLIALSFAIVGATLAGSAATPPEALDQEKGQVEALIAKSNAEARLFRNSQPQPAWQTSTARKQIQALWDFGREHRQTPAGAQATLEALRTLQSLGRHDELRAKVDSIAGREPIWSDVMWIVLQEAVASGDFDPFVAKATWVINSTEDTGLRGRLWFTIGRVHREHGRPLEAVAAYRKAAETPSDPALADAANGAIYEMGNLNPGQAAPAFTASLLSGDPISLEKLRGKVVLIDFWGSA